MSKKHEANYYPTKNRRMRNSFYNPQCDDCFLRFREANPYDTGCIGLTSVPFGVCSFHKTPAEQERSLLDAAKRNGELKLEQQRRLDQIRIF